MNLFSKFIENLQFKLLKSEHLGKNQRLKTIAEVSADIVGQNGRLSAVRTRQIFFQKSSPPLHTDFPVDY